MFCGMSMQRAIVGRVVAMRNPTDIFFCGDERCAIRCLCAFIYRMLQNRTLTEPIFLSRRQGIDCTFAYGNIKKKVINLEITKKIFNSAGFSHTPFVILQNGGRNRLKIIND